MKDALNNGSAVQASNSLGSNGGILGAVVAGWQKAQDIKITKGLIDYKHNLSLDRDVHRTAMNIAADQARLSTSNQYNMARDAANAKSKLDQIKEGGRQKRLTTTHTNKSGVKTMKDMTAGLETSAGLPLSGGISSMVAGPGQFQGQLQALKGHPHLGINPSAKPATAAEPVTTSATVNKTSRSKKAKAAPTTPPIAKADPSKVHFNPVPGTVANPFTPIPAKDQSAPYVKPTKIQGAKITKPRVTKTQKAEGM